MGVNKIIIAHYYNPGSAATNRILAYAKGFAEMGIDVVLVLGASCNVVIPILPGIEVTKVESTHFLLPWKMSIAIKHFYEKGRTAILVYGTPILSLFFRKSQYNLFYECTEVPLYGKESGFFQRLKERIIILLAKRATGMFVISRALLDYFAAYRIKEICVINMFVDGNRFSSKTVDESGAKYVAYCGTISPHKDGVDVLIKAFSLFVRWHGDYVLKIIGRFENQESEIFLKNLVRDLGLENLVCFTGAVSPEEIPIMLCRARMLALARPNNKQAKYGFPTKLGEYLATGKPVVVTDVGEIGLFLKDLNNCRLAQPDNPEDFARKMDWIEAHYPEAIEMGSRGKQLISDAFSSVHQCAIALDFMNKKIKSNSN